jgi:hypothetical protein
MATVTVTFTRGNMNDVDADIGSLAVGNAARSEVITLPATGDLVAAASENVVELLASDDCWIAIGQAPDPAEDSGGFRNGRFLKADLPYQYTVTTGDKVAGEV